MIDALYVPLLVGCGVVAAWMLVVALRNHVPTRPEYIAVGVVQAALVVDVIGGFVGIGSVPGNRLVYGAYLLGILAILPFAIVWSRNDDTRWSGVVVLVGLLSVMVMLVRITQLATHG